LNRLATGFLAAAILLSVTTPTVAATFTSNSFSVQVYADGSTFVTQRLAVSQSSASVQVPLLTAVLSNVVATDQNGSPLSFKISGSNITIYSLGATGVTLQYDSQNLTSKKGTVWTLAFTSAYNATVTLPRQSTLSYISGTPYSLSVQDTAPVATIPPGKWEISYGVAIGTSSTTSTSTSPGGSGGGPYLGFTPQQLVEVAAIAGVVVVAILAVRWWRRRLDLGPQGADLRPDDVQVLNFIQEKGGKVLEPEIRTRFALPKTSAWRQIKRLERMGYVKVTKIGSQNQIELVKNKEPGA
jgi:uncharacterized membrane protein